MNLVYLKIIYFFTVSTILLILLISSNIFADQTAQIIADEIRSNNKTDVVDAKGDVIIINHGEYYTLYAKLKNLKVEKGDIISKNQEIADLVTNNDGVTQLQFQIWKNNIKLNPENWIIKK